MGIYQLSEREGRFPVPVLFFLGLILLVFAGFKNDSSSADAADPSPAKAPVINAAVSEF